MNTFLKKTLVGLVIAAFSLTGLAQTSFAHQKAVRNGPSLSEMNKLTGDLRDNQCTAAAVYTLLPAETRPSYPDFVSVLEKGHYLSQKGATLYSMLNLFSKLGHPARFYPKSPTLHLDIADAVRRGHAVLVVVDALQSLKAQYGAKAQVNEEVRNAMGVKHVIRLTDVRWNGVVPVDFGVYDSNKPDGGRITAAELKKMLYTLKPALLLHGGTGAFITDAPWRQDRVPASFLRRTN